MMGHITHTLTSNLEQFLITLTSLGIVAISGLIVLALVHKSNNRVFGPLAYLFTVVNVGAVGVCGVLIERSVSK